MTSTPAGVAATALFAVCTAEVVIAVVCGIASGMGWGALNELLVMSNATIGLALGASGWPIAAFRPRNPIGWLLLGGGISYASTAAGITALACVPATDSTESVAVGGRDHQHGLDLGVVLLPPGGLDAVS
ncbi:MAG TPA: hypothetical protein VIT41_01300 [Microlunatus sp.]